MTHQQALKILMLSPVYFRLDPHERMQLVKDYCRQFMEIQKGQKAAIGRS
jgi:hypothetical protein